MASFIRASSESRNSTNSPRGAAPLSRIGLEARADALAVCRYDPTRAVCRAIVDDDHFQRLIGLFKSTVDGSGDKFLIVAIDDYNRRQRAPSMHGVRAHWYHLQDTI